MEEASETELLTTRKLALSLVRWLLSVRGVLALLAGAAFGAAVCVVVSSFDWMRGDPSAWWISMPVYFGVMVAGTCANDYAESEFVERFYKWQNTGGWKWIGGMALAATVGVFLALRP